MSTSKKKAAAKAVEEGEEGTTGTKRIPVNVFFDRDMLVEVDDWQFANRFRRRTDAIRFVMRAGLDALKQQATLKK